jgi:hypothetical protein
MNMEALLRPAEVIIKNKNAILRVDPACKRLETRIPRLKGFKGTMIANELILAPGKIPAGSLHIRGGAIQILRRAAARREGEEEFAPNSPFFPIRPLTEKEHRRAAEVEPLPAHGDVELLCRIRNGNSRAIEGKPIGILPCKRTLLSGSREIEGIFGKLISLFTPRCAHEDERKKEAKYTPLHNQW